VLHADTARRLFDAGDVVRFPFTASGATEVTVVNEIGAPAVRQQERRPPEAAGPHHQFGAGVRWAGDIVVRGRYFVLDERGWLPTIAIRAHVKAPTADATTGLGTGRLDQGVGIDVSRSLGAGAMLMVDGGYTVIGQPAGVEYNNNWWYDVGRPRLGGVVSLSAFFEEPRHRSAPMPATCLRP
jgi:hypothetical protein